MIKASATQRNSRVHYIVAAVYISWTSQALGFIDVMAYGSWGGKSGDIITEIINLLGIATSLLLFWWGIHRRRPHLKLVLPLMSVGIVVCSVLWSVEPRITLTQGIAYLFIVVGAIGLAKTIDANEVMELTASVYGLLATVSLLLLIVLPSEVTDEVGFRGVLSHKNPFGWAMAIGIFAALHGLRTGRRKLRHGGIIAICALAGVLSKSTTSLITVFAFFAVHVIGSLYVKGGHRRFISGLLAVIAALVAIVVLSNEDALFSFLGKDPSLTGRTDLWPHVIDAIAQRPLLGWGFAAFWSLSNPRSNEISALLGWYVTEAHNGLLEVLLDVGLVGTALFLFMFVRNLMMAVKCMNGPAPEIGVSALLLLVGVLIIGVSEHVLVAPDGLTAQFFLLAFMCEQALRSRVATISTRAGPRSAETFSYRDAIHSYP
jgi:exopolysaccharide production protein ExoQ